MQHKTVLDFLLHPRCPQPNSDITSKFDDFLLLARGMEMYNGPWLQSMDYFMQQGYRYAVLRTISYKELTTTHACFRRNTFLSHHTPLSYHIFHTTPCHTTPLSYHCPRPPPISCPNYTNPTDFYLSQIKDEATSTTLAQAFAKHRVHIEAPPATENGAVAQEEPVKAPKTSMAYQTGVLAARCGWG